MTPETWARQWAYLVAAYPAARPDDTTSEVFWDQLRGYYDHEIERAVRRHVGRSKWFPSVSELIQLMAMARLELGGDWDTVRAGLELEAAGKDPARRLRPGLDDDDPVQIPGLDLGSIGQLPKGVIE